MQTREEAIAYCTGFPDVYEDYPFHDSNWTVMRCRGNKKTFAYIYLYGEHMVINVKVDKEWRDFWRSTYASVIPGYHMSKEHWNTIILDGTIPGKDIERMIGESFDLVRPRRNKSLTGESLTEWRRSGEERIAQEETGKEEVTYDD